jgi:pimeloyl-ACP methyl ester carboxylesterase
MEDIRTQTDLMSPIITLKDGRALGFASFGAPLGRPVLYFHGGDSSRLEAQWYAEAAAKLNIWLIAPDRPGFGLSEFQPGRTILDWSKDLVQLVDALGIDQFSVLGLSGGAPFVAAACLKLPHRIRRATIVSGIAPPEMPQRLHGMWFPVRMIFFLARWFPRLNAVFLRQMAKFYANPARMIARMKQSLPEPDQVLLEQRPEIFEIFSLSAQEAHRNGVQGDAWEWRLYVKPWGLRLSEIKTEIELWYGEYDRNTPQAMGHYYSHHFAKSYLNIVHNGGHFSTINNHIEPILTYLGSC